MATMKKTPQNIKAAHGVLASCGFSTQQQWRQKKRKELARLIDAFDDLRLGCYYCPCGTNGEIEQVQKILEQWKKDFSQRSWGK